MHFDLPPKPAIIRLGEPWEHRVGVQLAAAGLPIGARLAVLDELRRLRNADGLIRRPALADLSRWSGVKLAMLPGITPMITRRPALVVASTTSLSASGTTHAVSLPSGSGGMLLAIVGTDADRTFTWPAGWSEIFDWEASPGGATTGFSAAYRVADGSEGSTVTATASSGGTTGAGIGLRIANFRGVFEAALGTETSTAAPNPPSLTPSWGFDRSLWIAAVYNRATADNISLPPTNYSGLIQKTQTGGNGANIGVAFRDLVASSEDPGAFTLTGSSGFASPLTMAIRSAG
jgi:hypothetical protein